MQTLVWTGLVSNFKSKVWLSKSI